MEVQSEGGDLRQGRDETPDDSQDESQNSDNESRTRRVMSWRWSRLFPAS